MDPNEQNQIRKTQLGRIKYRTETRDEPSWNFCTVGVLINLEPFSLRSPTVRPTFAYVVEIIC